MNAYFDTSAIAKLVLEEPGGEAVLTAWHTLDDGFAASFGYVELRAALEHARRDGRPAHPDPPMDTALADQVWEQLVEVPADAAVVAAAVLVAVDRGLRTLDVIHLASALVVKGDEPLAFVSFDRRLRAAAAAEGLVVLPTDA